MDAVRYYLATSVLIAHFNFMGGHDIPWPTSSHTAVGGFFALSGFLVYGSYLRNPSLINFIKRRARRILPPYVFIVLLCTFGLSGATTLSTSEYFASADWWKYLFANLFFLNFLQSTLPGVFESSEYAVHAVNGSLWTMKVEWMLYLSVPIVAWLHTRLNWRRLPTLLGMLAFSIGYRILFYYMYADTGNELYNILSRQVFGQLSYFYVGVIIYFYLDQFMKWKWQIIAIATAITLLSPHIPFYNQWLDPLVSGSAVIWFSMVGNWGKWMSGRNNVSYDIYLFHFPVIQLSIFTGINALPSWQALAIVMTATIALANLSWHCIGKHFMKHTHKQYR
ncbi:MAG: acyltransferase [Muribaculaceae bacterium]|nr:acyltransferase [Muribaculaceae bacterium]